MVKIFRNNTTAAALIVGVSVFMLSGCAKPVAEPVAEPLATKPLIKPEIDYSSETPDCETAGKRLAENIEVGMTLGDARRLVGKPTFRLPTTWWWSRGISKTGKPYIEFPLVLSDDDVKITNVVTDVSGC
jgi:hypothetical protein